MILGKRTVDEMIDEKKVDERSVNEMTVDETIVAEMEKVVMPVH